MRKTPQSCWPSRQPLRVLIVEDDPNDAELMAAELARHGFQLSWERVETEADYLEHLEHAPEVILSDFNLPQFNAPRALILAQEQGIAVPFIVVSGAVGEEAAAAIIKQGAADFVHKSHLTRVGPVVLKALQGHKKIAYFSMEIALESAIPTYSGGLGVLAGDTIRSAADLHVPMVAVSLLHRSGHFQQQLDQQGWQSEQSVSWRVDDFLSEMPARTSLCMEGRMVHLRCWKYQVDGVDGYAVPVYLLDTDLSENTDWDRQLTAMLYGGDAHYRLCQEIVLGVGGIRMLHALGYDALDRFHMNEGHASLLILELLQESARQAGREHIEGSDLVAVRQKCIFTTHTPVPAGHDQFALSSLSNALGFRADFSDLCDPEMVVRVFGRHQPRGQASATESSQGVLNMTHLGLNMSRYVNGVAKKHGEVSRLLFTGYHIEAITNGVHARTWTALPFQRLYDRYIPDWRQDNFSLRHAEAIPLQEIWEAHQSAKRELLDYVNHDSDISMSQEVFTIGFARRVTAYKRADLVLTDPERLIRMVREIGGLQLIYAGKAHPSDQEGKALIRRIFELKQQLQGRLAIAFLPNYDLFLARLLTAGVDLWLNTPQPPLEASGTSGMKAALNGIPSLSILDGWWVEGWAEGVTGWAIGEEGQPAEHHDATTADACQLYRKLETVILPMFYQRRHNFVEVMRHAIAINGSFFNTQRMLQQYVLNAYFR